MSWQTHALFTIGLALLVLGANWFVKGASRLAAVAGVSPLVIGLTVVAFGTSAPEFAVSVQSSWSGRTDMAVGNVVGSNICNVLLILGMSAAITPLVVAQQLVRRDVPVVIVLSALVWWLAHDGALGRLDGALLLGVLVAYTVWIVRVSRRETRAVRAEYAAEYGTAAARTSPAWLDLVWLAVGLVLLVLGSGWLVDAAVTYARSWGVRDVVVSLTVVAIGTSLPEVATSVTAALRGERDIAVGNVVGSNVFNLLGVLGLSTLVSPAGLTVGDAMIGFDLPVMVAVAFACLPVFARGAVIPRWQGVLFLLGYGAYTAYLVLAETDRDASDRYAAAMVRFVLPIVGVTLAVVAFRVLTRRERHPTG